MLPMNDFELTVPDLYVYLLCTQVARETLQNIEIMKIQMHFVFEDVEDLYPTTIAFVCRI